jgi:transcription antitermination protein NusB
VSTSDASTGPDDGGGQDPGRSNGVELPGPPDLPDELPPMPADGPEPDGGAPLLEYRGGGVGSRREARERALALLYEADAKAVTPRAVLDALPLEAEPFTAELVAGVDAHQDEIDQLLRSYARGWTLERMPTVDRALLRLATFELVHLDDVPTGAVISEAVELAQHFSTDESGRFVNGMLSAIAADVRP